MELQGISKTINETEEIVILPTRGRDCSESVLS